VKGHCYDVLLLPIVVYVTVLSDTHTLSRSNYLFRSFSLFAVSVQQPPERASRYVRSVTGQPRSTPLLQRRRRLGPCQTIEFSRAPTHIGLLLSWWRRWRTSLCTQRPSRPQQPTPLDKSLWYTLATSLLIAAIGEVEFDLILNRSRLLQQQQL
jgi:hypothetical protein